MRVQILTACCYLAGTLFFISGCDSGGAYKPVQTDKNKTGDTFGHGDHSHEHGPHGGHIIELGKHEFHGELVLDEKTKVIGVYLYGPDNKTPALTDAKSAALNLKIDGKIQTLELAAKALEGETGGKSSHFELAPPADLAKHLTDIEHLEGALQVVINDKPVFGAFKPHEHDHGDHKHDGHKHDADDHADHKEADHKDDGHKHDGDEHGDHKDDAHDHKDGDHKDDDHKHEDHKDGDAKEKGDDKGATNDNGRSGRYVLDVF